LAVTCGARKNEEDPGMPGQEVVYEVLKQVYDPEVGINIVDMGSFTGWRSKGKRSI